MSDRHSPRVVRSSSQAFERAQIARAHSDGLPRERLAGSGARALSDAEVVALLLRTGSSERNAVALAHETLRACGGLVGLGRRSCFELERLGGLGPAKASSLVAAFELGRRVASRPLQRGATLNGPDDVFRHFAPLLGVERRECFLVVMLDGRHRILGDETVSIGTLTASLVHPREVFRPALVLGASAIVAFHNHPSGELTPSAEDFAVTERLVRAGDLVGVALLDHLVLAGSRFHSFADAGQLLAGASLDGTGT